MTPRPGAYFNLPVPGENRHIRLLAHPGCHAQGNVADMPPGRVCGLVSGRLAIACADGTYHIPSVQPAGKKSMDATAFACGYLNKIDCGIPLVCPAPEDLLA